MKQSIISALRSVGLLHRADWMRYQINHLTEWRANRQFRSSQPDLIPPPPHLLYEISSSTALRYYWNDGRRMADFFWHHMNLYLPQPNPSVCEWGCGVGRIIRQLRAAANGKIGRLDGLDRDRAMIEWCRSAIPDLEFHVNKDMPPTDIPDATYDAVYCWSVFTHLSEVAHHAWIAELTRIVKPGGIVLFTTIGSQHNLLPIEKAAQDSGKLVVRQGPIEGARIYLAYASPSFVRKLVAGHQLLNFVPDTQTHIGQDLWVIRRN
jgi:2-polyprenyl-3-methyl-5-hydroxy-6-metoxy-1,4-benzoquinol methylase